MTRQASPIRRRVLTALAAAVAAPVLRAQGRADRGRLVIAVPGKGGFAWLPLLIAEQQDYFRAEGLEVELAEQESHARALQALQSGAADLIAGGFDQALAQLARGQPLESLVLLARAPQVAVGVSLRALPRYASPADLRGRRIGVLPAASWGNLVAAQVLARAGVRAGEVQYLGVPAAQAMAALRAGQVDAVCHADPLITQLEQRSEIRVIGDTRTLKGTQEVFGGNLPSACLAAPPELVQRHPGSCQAVVHAVVHALKWLQTAGPSDIIKTVPEPYLLGDRALYLASFARVRESISPDGLLSEDGARTALRALTTWDPVLRTERIETTRAYTNEFARRAKERFKL